MHVRLPSVLSSILVPQMPVEPAADSRLATAIVPAAHTPNRWRLFWRTVTRFDRSKIIPWIALRNTIGVALPLAAGILTGATLSGVAIAVGALNVAYSDGEDSYPRRARRMMLAGVLTRAPFSSAASWGAATRQPYLSPRYGRLLRASPFRSAPPPPISVLSASSPLSFTRPRDFPLKMQAGQGSSRSPARCFKSPCPSCSGQFSDISPSGVP